MQTEDKYRKIYTSGDITFRSLNYLHFGVEMVSSSTST